MVPLIFSVLQKKIINQCIIHLRLFFIREFNGVIFWTKLRYSILDTVHTVVLLESDMCKCFHFTNVYTDAVTHPFCIGLSFIISHFFVLFSTSLLLLSALLLAKLLSPPSPPWPEEELEAPTPGFTKWLRICAVQWIIPHCFRYRAPPQPPYRRLYFRRRHPNI